MWWIVRLSAIGTALFFGSLMMPWSDIPHAGGSIMCTAMIFGSGYAFLLIDDYDHTSGLQ